MRNPGGGAPALPNQPCLPLLCFGEGWPELDPPRVMGDGGEQWSVLGTAAPAPCGGAGGGQAVARVTPASHKEMLRCDPGAWRRARTPSGLENSHKCFQEKYRVIEKSNEKLKKVVCGGFLPFYFWCPFFLKGELR